MLYSSNIGNMEFFISPDNSSHRARLTGSIIGASAGINKIILMNRDSMKVIGSTIAYPDGTWEINTEYSSTEELIVICLDETGTYNGLLYDNITLCYVDFSYSYLDKSFKHNSPKYRKSFNISFNSSPYNGVITEEDVKGNIDSFRFDTVTASGVMVDSLSSAVSLTNSKIGPGSSVITPSYSTIIKSVDGDGTSSNAITIDSVKSGHTFTTQILGDSSCVLFAPLVGDNRGYGYNHTNIIERELNVLEGIDSKCNSVGTSTTTPRTLFAFQDVKLPQSDYSISFWMKTNTASVSTLVTQYLGFEIYDNGSYIYIRVNTNGGLTFNTTTPAYLHSMTNNVWYHYVFAFGSAGYTIWRNGSQVATGATNMLMIPSTHSTAKNSTLCILSNQAMGYEGTATNNNRRISHLRIFNKRVTLSEVNVLYNETYTAGGKDPVSRIKNITNNNFSITCNSYNISNNSTTLNSSTIKPIFNNLDSINVNDVVNHNTTRVIYKGNHLRKMSASSNSSYSSGYPNLGFSDITDAAQFTGGWYPDTSTDYKDLPYKKIYYQVAFDKIYVITALRLRTYNYTSNYDYPNELYVYTSTTGKFRGEEIYRGILNIRGATTYNTLTDWAEPGFLIHGKYIRFYINNKSTNFSSTSGFGFRSIIFEVEVPKHSETIKARSIIVDIANNYGDTGAMTITKLIPTLNGEPVSSLGWKYYQTSFYSTYSSYAEKAMDPCYSYMGDNYEIWRSSTNVVTNQRIIAVAPKEFEFDDLYFTNGHIGSLYTEADMGAMNAKIEISSDAITNTTYSGAISNSTTIFSGALPSLYTSSTYSTNISQIEQGVLPMFLGAGSKVIAARAVAFDFPKNNGDPLFMGVRAIGFYLKGIRIYYDGGTQWTCSVSSGSATYARSTFQTSISTIGAYATYSPWKSASGSTTNQRITVLFDAVKKFDAIRIYGHFNGSISTTYEVNMGPNSVTAYGSLHSAQPPSTYGSQWTNSFNIFPNTPVPPRALATSTSMYDYMYYQLGKRKIDTWSARSVVFDIHSNHGGNGVGVKQLVFKNNGCMLSNYGQSAYSSHNDTGFEAINAFNLIMDPSIGAGSGYSWYSSNSTPARLIVVFDEVKSFNEICVINWWVANGAIEMERHKGINELTITITSGILTAGDTTYNQTISNGTIIYEGGVGRKSLDYSSTVTNVHLQTIVKKDESFYSNVKELIIHSDNNNGSAEFIDSGYRNFSITTSGTITHSTDQSIIGVSSITTSSGYLTVPDLAGRNFESSFSIGMWVYPTSTAGDKGLFSRWGTSGSYGYMLSINSGYLEFKYSTNGTSITTCTSSGSVPTNEWSWVEMKRAGDTIHLSVDELAAGNFDIGFSTIFDANAQVNIGSYNSSVSNCFQGYIQEVLLKTGGCYYPTPNVGPTTFTSIDTSLPITASGIVSTSLSFDEYNKTYKVFNNNEWRSIASCDPDIHGVVSGTNWHYRNDYDTWSSVGIYNKENAISEACKYSNNVMSIDTINALYGTQYSGTGGFNSGYNLSISNTLMMTDYSKVIGINDITINGKKYWVSSSTILLDTPTSVSGSLMDWTVTKEHFLDTEADQFINAMSIFNWVNGSGWVQCQRGGQVPALTIGTTASGVELLFKAEMDSTNYKYFRKDRKATLYVEIN